MLTNYTYIYKYPPSVTLNTLEKQRTVNCHIHFADSVTDI